MKASGNACMGMIEQRSLCMTFLLKLRNYMERKVLLASISFGRGTSAGRCFKLSGYTSGRVMVVYSMKGLRGI